MNYFDKQHDPMIDWSRVDPVALGMLSTAREIAEVPFKITSTYRDPEHSISVGGSLTDAHTENPCTAFDIGCGDARTRFKIIKGLIAAGFKRIGINQYHVHVDNSKTHDQEVFWIE